MHTIIDVIRLTESGNLDTLCLCVLDKCLGACNLQHGYIAAKRSLRSPHFQIIALSDPSPRHFTDMELSHRLSDVPTRDLVIPLRYRGDLCGFVVLWNTTRMSDVAVKAHLEPLVPVTVSSLLGGFQSAQDSTESHEMILATMSHEIRTPLNGVVGMTRLLRNDTGLAANHHMWSDVAYNCGMQLMEIINDLLDYSRMDAGKLEIEKAPFDVEQCISDAHDVVMAHAAEKGLSLTTELDPNIPMTVITDCKRVRQILINLLNNSIKFTQRGGIVTRVRANRSKNQIELEVEDSGDGIDAANFDRIFQSFVRLTPHDDADLTPQNSKYRRAEGTGLGLSICHKLATLLGGSIHVKRSSVGRGTVMLCCIPVEIGAQTTPALLLENITDRGVLVVDSNADRRLALFDRLVRLHMKPIVCSTASEAAIYVHREFEFDIVFSEPSLANGWERQLRTKNTPMIAIGMPDKRMTACWDGHEKSIETVLANIYRGASVKRRYGTLSRRPRPPRDNLSILIVEDVAYNTQVLKETLKDLGYSPQSIDEVDNGMRAVELCASKRYSIIFMDLRLPGMDGFAAARIILDSYRIQGVIPPPPIVPVTAYVTDVDKRRCVGAGMTGFLTKPVSTDDLVKVLSKV